MPGWFKTLFGAKPASPQESIPDSLWHPLLAHYPFLAQRPQEELLRLRQLSRQFLRQKEFHGAQGLVISDDMAVAIATQACLPILNLGPRALDWYDDFVGIVVHPAEVVARRETMDDAGVVHQYSEVLSGEAMEGGPVTLSWQDVAAAGESAEQGYNLVIHEFIHKIDMRSGTPDGCPPLPAGFMGAPTARAARAAWLALLQAQYQGFQEKVAIAERFGGQPTWLDPYGAQSIDEFFAVASEGYFVNRHRFALDFAPLLPMFDAFFNPAR